MNKYIWLAILLIISTPCHAKWDENRASNQDVSTKNFSGNLSSSDSTVQKALDTLDDMSAGSVSGSDTEVQFNDGGSAFGADANFIYNKTSDYIGLGGATAQIHMSPSHADDGMFLYSTGTSNFYVLGGLNWNGSAWVAKSASNESISGNGGAVAIYTDTGKVVGNTFTPTWRANVDANGIQIPASTYYNFGVTGGTSGYGFRDSSGTVQYKNSGGSWTNVAIAANADLPQTAKTVQISYILDGGGSAITTGQKHTYHVSFPITLTSVTMTAEQTGSLVVGIWKDTYANYPPTNADWITAAATPTILVANKSQDTTLNGWNAVLRKDDVLLFNVESAATITKCTITLAGYKL